MAPFTKTLIIIAFVAPLLTACGNEETDVVTPEPPTAATYDNATFDTSTWE